MSIFSLVIEIRSGIDFRTEVTPQLFLSESDAMQGVYDYLADSIKDNDILTDHLAELAQPLASKLYSIKHESLVFDRDSLARLDKVEWDLLIDFFCDFHNNDSSETFFYYNISKHQSVKGGDPNHQLLNTVIKSSEQNEPIDEMEYCAEVTLNAQLQAIEFLVYPKAIQDTDIPKAGISGKISIRNGRPLLELGQCDDLRPLKIASDLEDRFIMERISREHQLREEVVLAEGSWLHEARLAIAQQRYTEFLEVFEKWSDDSPEFFDGTTFKRGWNGEIMCSGNKGEFEITFKAGKLDLANASNSKRAIHPHPLTIEQARYAYDENNYLCAYWHDDNTSTVITEDGPEEFNNYLEKVEKYGADIKFD